MIWIYSIDNFFNKLKGEYWVYPFCITFLVLFFIFWFFSRLKRKQKKNKLFDVNLISKKHNKLLYRYQSVLFKKNIKKIKISRVKENKIVKQESKIKSVMEKFVDSSKKTIKKNKDINIEINKKKVDVSKQHKKEEKDKKKWSNFVKKPTRTWTKDS